jgi:hypothetical protein
MYFKSFEGWKRNVKKGRLYAAFTTANGVAERYTLRDLANMKVNPPQGFDRSDIMRISKAIDRYIELGKK